MKKLLLILTCIFSLSTVFAQKKIQIIASIFPQYDWLKNICEGSPSVEVSLLNQNGTDMHSFQPKVSDVVKITSSDMFVFVGGESDGWVKDIFANTKKSNTVKIPLLDELDKGGRAKAEGKALEGEEEDDELDEHVWLSLKNAVFFCEKLSSEVAKLDPANAALYINNAVSYCAKLSALDKDFQNAAASIKKTLVFADRFPFIYFCEDYSLKYCAAFSGCSTETDAGFRTILSLAKKIDEENLGSILKIEDSKDTVARTVIKAAKKKSVEILVLDSMQSISRKQIIEGTTYLSVMEKNLSTLKNVN